MRRRHPFGGLVDDLRQAWRGLRADPARSALVTATLAIGLGVSLAVLAVVYDVLLAPLPYAQPERLVLVSTARASDGTRFGLRLPAVRQWREVLSGAGDVAAYRVATLVAVTDDVPRAVRVATVDERFFEVLQPRDLRGPALGPETAEPAVVISDRLAASLGISDAIGSTIGLGDRSYPVVGVLSRTGAFPDEQVDAWMSIDDEPASPEPAMDVRRYRLIARLRDGVEPEDLRAIGQGYLDENPSAHEIPETRPTLAVERLRERLLGPAVPTLSLCLVAAVLVLVVAAANASLLLVARAIGRWREVAIRSALGAARARLLRCFAVESLLLGAGALLVGGALAGLVLDGLQALGLQLPRADDLALRLPVLLGGGGVAVLTALGAGIVAGLYGLRADPERMLRRTAAAHTSSRRLTRGLVTLQIAVSMVLLVGAGLLSRTVSELRSADTGTARASAVTTRLMLGQGNALAASDRGPFMAELLRRVRGLPAARAAGMGSVLPPNRAGVEVVFTIIEEDRQEALSFNMAAATPGFLEAMGIETVRGRPLRETDLGSSEPVAVVSRGAAEKLFPDLDPLGRTLPAATPFGSGEKARVVGVVEDATYLGLGAPSIGTIYVPWSELPVSNMYLVVRSDLGDAIVPAIRRLIHDMDPRQAFAESRSIADLIADATSGKRTLATAAAALAALALLLALLGLFGAMARAVVERRREIALRVILGATPARVRRVVVREGLAMAVGGLTVGSPCALVAGRFLSGALYGVSFWDPPTLLGGAAVVLAAALLAAWLPARRATGVALEELLRSP